MTYCNDCGQPLRLLNTLGSLQVLQCFNCTDDFGSGRVFMQEGVQVLPPQERVVRI